MNRALISNGEFSIYLLQMGLEQWKDSSSSEDTESTGTVRRRKNVTVNLFSRSVEIQSKVSPKAVTYEWKDKNDSRIHGITKCFSFAIFLPTLIIVEVQGFFEQIGCWSRLDGKRFLGS